MNKRKVEQPFAATGHWSSLIPLPLSELREEYKSEGQKKASRLQHRTLKSLTGSFTWEQSELVSNPMSCIESNFSKACTVWEPRFWVTHEECCSWSLTEMWSFTRRTGRAVTYLRNAEFLSTEMTSFTVKPHKPQYADKALVEQGLNSQFPLVFLCSEALFNSELPARTTKPLFMSTHRPSIHGSEWKTLCVQLEQKLA